MRCSTWRAGLALACAVSAATAAGADEAGQSGAACGTSVTAEILGVLRDAGNIDQARYEALCARARGDSEAPAVAASEAEEKPTWNFKWSNFFRLTRSDGAFDLKFGGRIMLDGAFIWEGDGLRNRFSAIGVDPRDGSGVEFRRVRIFFSGTIYDRAFFKMQYDFADDGVAEFKDIYVGLQNLGPLRQVRVGNFKEPFMLQDWTSSKYITFMERGLNQTFFPGRNMGVMGMGYGFDEEVFWQLGLFRVTDDQGQVFNDWGDAAYDLAARVSAAPIYSDDGARVLHLGVDYIHRFNQDAAGAAIGSVRLEQRPEARLAQLFADTGDFIGSDSDILNLEAAVIYGPFSAQAEWTFDWVQGNRTQKDVGFWGGYVYASYFLTGEHRNYEKGNARFGRVNPKHNFNPIEGDWGAWEIAARYSILDLNDRNVTGGKLWDVTAGLNWYLFPNMRWMLNYVYGNVRQRGLNADAIRGAANILETRFQFDF